jgi:Carbohydrate binding module (family 6)
LLGASVAFNGTTFTYGPSNAPDAFTNVTVALTPGSFSSLNILAYAIYGDQPSQTFQVNYTNGTYSTVTQSISDWGIPGNYSGETKVATMAYRNTSSGGENSGTTTYVYGYTLPVNSGLTVESITLPANNNVRVLGIQDEATSAVEAPYDGTPAGIPGTVLAENYDTGGAGVGYYVNSVNGTDNGYRSDGVDLETASAPATGNDIGWTSTGQWFRYTVNIAAAGTYNVTFEVAAPSAVTDGFHIANSSGTNLSGSVNVPSTGGWQTWTTVTASVTLPAGQQVLTIYQDNGGWNIDSAAFAATSLPYNVNAIFTNGSTFSSTSGADGEGNAFSATLLGASVAFNGTTFTYGPSNAPDAFNNVTIPLSAGTFSSLNILAYAINGGQASQTFTIHYTNGTTSTATQSISDWGIPQGYSGETKVVTMAYRNTNTGGETSYTSYVYGYTLPVNSSLTVSSISTPANGNVFVLGVQDEQ